MYCLTREVVAVLAVVVLGLHDIHAAILCKSPQHACRFRVNTGKYSDYFTDLCECPGSEKCSMDWSDKNRAIVSRNELFDGGTTNACDCTCSEVCPMDWYDENRANHTRNELYSNGEVIRMYCSDVKPQRTCSIKGEVGLILMGTSLYVNVTTIHTFNCVCPAQDYFVLTKELHLGFDNAGVYKCSNHMPSCKHYYGCKLEYYDSNPKVIYPCLCPHSQECPNTHTRIVECQPESRDYYVSRG